MSRWSLSVCMDNISTTQSAIKMKWKFTNGLVVRVALEGEQNSQIYKQNANLAHSPTRTMPVSLFPLHCYQVTLSRWLTEQDKPPVKYCFCCLKHPLAEWSLLSLTKPFMFYSPLVDGCRRQDETQAARSSLTSPKSIRQNAGRASLWEPGENNKAFQEDGHTH